MNEQFSSKRYNEVKNFIINADKNPNVEFEVRFSTYIKPDLFVDKTNMSDIEKPINYSFVPVIEKNLFKRILQKWDETCVLPKFEEVSIDYLYERGIRKTICNNKVLFTKKDKILNVDYWDLNIRLSKATENNIKQEDINMNLLNYPTMIRKKERKSFFDVDIRYDFTIIETQDNRKNKSTTKFSYEIELEYIGNKMDLRLSPSLDDKCCHLLNSIMRMLQELQESQFVITTFEKCYISIEYSARLKKPQIYFIGAQPETFHKEHLAKISTNYSITEKYDGERYLLIFSSYKNKCYLLDRRMRVKGCDIINEKCKGTILDTEIVNNKIFAFDILFHGRTDLRGNTDFNLKERLLLMDKVVKTSSCKKIPLLVKEYVFDNFNNIYHKLQNNNFHDDIPRDGLIFTPINEFYPIKAKWQNLLKWKPSDKNSIDFYITFKVNNPYIWELFVGDIDNQMVLFEHCPTINVSHDLSKKFINSGVVVECVWDKKMKTFLPIRERKDKNKPNFKSIANDVYKSIQHPVELSDFLYKPFQNLRLFHNTLKKHIIKKSYSLIQEMEQNVDNDDDDDYIYNILHDLKTDQIDVLDLACGRGGDLWKWNSLPIKVVNFTGIDINNEYITEAKQRLKEKKNSCLNATFYQLDLRKDCIKKSETLYDIISCQFALHYFYENSESFSNFIKIVKDNIKDNGVFLATLFDGYRVFELCMKGINKQSSFEIIPQFDTRIGLPFLKNKEFSVGASVVLHGDDDLLLKTSTTEYLIFADIFIKRMRSEGFYLSESFLFSDIPNYLPFSKTEKLFSDLHRYYIFQYKKKDIELPFWKKVDWELHDIFNFNEDLEEIYVENNDFHYTEHYIFFYLEIITGKITTNILPEEYSKIAENFNIFLTIITCDENWEPNFSSMITEKPSVYLEDVKHVLFLDCKGKKKLIVKKDSSGIIQMSFKPKLLPTEEIPKKNEKKREDFEIMTIKQLKEYANEHLFKIPSSLRKGEIVDLVYGKALDL